MTQRTNWMLYDMKAVQLVLLISTHVVPQVTFGAVPQTSDRVYDVSRPTIIQTSSTKVESNDSDKEKMHSTDENRTTLSEKDLSQSGLDEVKIQKSTRHYERTQSLRRTSTYAPMESTLKEQNTDDKKITSTMKIEKILTHLSEGMTSKKNVLMSTLHDVASKLKTGEESLKSATRKLIPISAAEVTTSLSTVDETILMTTLKEFTYTSSIEELTPSSTTEESTLMSLTKESTPTSSTDALTSTLSTHESTPTSPTDASTPTSPTEASTPTSPTEESTPTSPTEASTSVYTRKGSILSSTVMETTPPPSNLKTASQLVTETTSLSKTASTVEIKSSYANEETTTDFPRSVTSNQKPKKTTKGISSKYTEPNSKTHYTPTKKYTSSSSATTPSVSQEPSPSSFGIPPDKTTYIPTSPATTKSYRSSFSWPSVALSTFIADMQNMSADTHSTTSQVATTSTTISAEPRIDPMQETKGLSTGGVVGVVMAVLVTLILVSGSGFALYRKKRTRYIDDAIHLMTSRRGHNVRFYYDSTI